MNTRKIVAIITILDNTNFGTYLQALSLSICIQQLGHTPLVIKYFRPDMTEEGYFKGLVKKLGFLHAVIRRLKTSTKRIWELRKEDYFFLEKFVKVTRLYKSFEDLNSDPPLADVYMTGSDQVWNSYYNNGIDKSFYLDFAPQGRSRVAYASSIGMDTIPTNEITETVRLLSKYKFISVREKYAQSLLFKHGINTTNVLDPTLLLNKEKWSYVASKFPIEREKDKYLLVYSVETKEQNKVLSKVAKKIADKYGLKIIYISYSSKQIGFYGAHKYYMNATPDKFLNLIKDASYVVVSSFHGTAFAINFNKQFYTVKPQRFNSRIDNILEFTGLQDRLITNENDITNKEIDYSNVNTVLSDKRNTSLEVLKSYLD